MKINKKKLWSMAETYYRAGLTVVAFQWSSGETDPVELAKGFAFGVVGLILKAVNPSFKEYGVGAK